LIVCVGRLHLASPDFATSNRLRLHGVSYTDTPEEWSAAVRSGQREDPLLSKLPLTSRSRLFQAKVLQALR
jgi:hypothetical protein